MTYHGRMWGTVIAIFASRGLLTGSRWAISSALWMLGRRPVLPHGSGGRLAVTHHHLLVLLMLLLLLNHQQLIVVLLLLLAGTHSIIGLRTMVGRVYHSVIRPGKIQGLLVASGGVVHAHGVLLLVHLLVHLLHTLEPNRTLLHLDKDPFNKIDSFININDFLKTKKKRGNIQFENYYYKTLKFSHYCPILNFEIF